jgi:hypothetical protein
MADFPHDTDEEVDTPVPAPEGNPRAAANRAATSRRLLHQLHWPSAPPAHPPRHKNTVSARDHGQKRLRVLTRWMSALALALAGGLTAITAESFHAHVLAASSDKQTTSTTTATKTSSATSSTASKRKHAVHTIPTATKSTPVVVSGGS